MSTSSRIRVGIVGASPNRGFASIAHIPALRALPQFEITAVCTTRQESAEAAARYFGVPLAFSNPEALARHPDVDLVTVSVKVPDHHRPVMAAIEAGKHVYCEWPLGRDTGEAVQMLDAAERSGIRHAVGLQGQVSPAINYARDLVADGYVGRVLTATMIGCAPNWGATIDRAYQADLANGANLMTITGGHQIDALCHCLGEFREVAAFVVSQRDRIHSEDAGGLIAKTSPDQLVVNGIVGDGAVVSFQIRGGMTRGTEFLFEIHGDKGDLALTATERASMQRQELKLQGAHGGAKALADLPVPASYRWVPDDVPPGSPYNVAQLYARLAERIRDGKSRQSRLRRGPYPASPDRCDRARLGHRAEAGRLGGWGSGKRQIRGIPLRRPDRRFTVASPKATMEAAVPLPAPVLDHVVIDVRDRMDEAARAFAALGFQLTPRGYHTLGSMNHLAMFATDYLELLGFGEGGANRLELAPFPIGLNGLVFKTQDADAVHTHALGAGLPILPVQAFSRPVTLDGARRDARFRTTRLDPGRIAMGRVYFCEHLTPELVWRPEWQSHPNGARAISRVIVATGDPRRTALLFSALFGPDAVVEREACCLVHAGGARVELMTPGAIAAELGDAAADPAERIEYLAALELKVSSLGDTAERLRAVPGVQIESRRVTVPARAAFNTTLVFSA